MFLRRWKRDRRAKLEEALEACLEAMARGEPLEACLERYPEQAEALRPLLETGAALMQVRLPEPRPEAVAAGRARVLAALRRQAVSSRTSRRYRGWKGGIGLPFLRPKRGERNKEVRTMRRPVPVALALALVLAVILGGGGVVKAAQGSLPGDVLYPVKQVQEKVELALALTPEQRVMERLEQAQRRLQEAQALAAQGEAVPPEVLAQAAQALETAMEEVQALSPQGVERAMTEVQRTQEVLQRVAQQVPAQAQPAMAQVQERVQQARQVLERVEATQGPRGRAFGPLAVTPTVTSTPPSPSPSPYPVPSPSPVPTGTVTPPSDAAVCGLASYGLRGHEREIKWEVRNVLTGTVTVVGISVEGPSGEVKDVEFHGKVWTGTQALPFQVATSIFLEPGEKEDLEVKFWGYLEPGTYTVALDVDTDGDGVADCTLSESVDVTGMEASPTPDHEDEGMPGMTPTPDHEDQDEDHDMPGMTPTPDHDDEDEDHGMPGVTPTPDHDDDEDEDHRKEEVTPTPTPTPEMGGTQPTPTPTPDHDDDEGDHDGDRDHDRHP